MQNFVAQNATPYQLSNSTADDSVLMWFNCGQMS